MRNALVIIDVQNYFINKYTGHLPRSISRFIKSHDFDYVLFIQFVNSKDSNWVKILGWEKMLDIKEAGIADELCEFVTKENVFVKHAWFSAFRSKKFVRFLMTHKILDLYVCGLDTDACVYTTTMEAFEKGFNVKLITDLCADHHGIKHHEMAIELLRRNLGKKVVISLKDVELTK